MVFNKRKVRVAFPVFLRLCVVPSLSPLSVSVSPDLIQLSSVSFLILSTTSTQLSSCHKGGEAMVFSLEISTNRQRICSKLFQVASICRKLVCYK